MTNEGICSTLAQLTGQLSADWLEKLRQIQVVFCLIDCRRTTSPPRAPSTSAQCQSAPPNRLERDKRNTSMRRCSEDWTFWKKSDEQFYKIKPFVQSPFIIDVPSIFTASVALEPFTVLDPNTISLLILLLVLNKQFCPAFAADSEKT